MARVHKRTARKDYPDNGIKKGDVYYQWQLYRQPLRRSKTAPKRSQLTSSSFLQTIYDIVDINLRDANEPEDFKNIAEEVRSAGEECQSSLDNMPEQLQEAESGQILQTRIDACEEWASNIESAADEFEQAISEISEEDVEARQEALDACREECESSEPDWG